MELEILKATGRDIVSFLIGSKGIPVLLLLSLLIYIRKYFAAAFCIISISYVVGLMSMGKHMNLYDFPLNVFLGFIVIGLLLLAWLGYMIFIKEPRTPRQQPRKRQTSIFRESPSAMFFRKHGSSVFIGG
ncbi:MAG: hypothetical protein ACYS8W_09345 [Planctomycetota bacterium]|jgi:hypothetical protein